MAYMTASHDHCRRAIRDSTWQPIPIPIWRQTLAQAKAIEARLVAAQCGGRVELEFGFPCAGYARRTAVGAAAAPGPRPGRRRSCDLKLTGGHHAPRRAAQRSSRSHGVKNIVAVASRQGRSWQIDHRGQSGAGLGGPGVPGWAAGRRHLRAQPAADDGSGRPQARDRPTASTSRRCGPTGSRSCRSAS